MPEIGSTISRFFNEFWVFRGAPPDVDFWGRRQGRAPYIKSISILNITYHIAYDLLYRLSLLASLASGTAPTHLWGARPDLRRLRRQTAAHSVYGMLSTAIG